MVFCCENTQKSCKMFLFFLILRSFTHKILEGLIRHHMLFFWHQIIYLKNYIKCTHPIHLQLESRVYWLTAMGEPSKCHYMFSWHVRRTCYDASVASTCYVFSQNNSPQHMYKRKGPVNRILVQFTMHFVPYLCLWMQVHYSNTRGHHYTALWVLKQIWPEKFRNRWLLDYLESFNSWWYPEYSDILQYKSIVKLW